MAIFEFIGTAALIERGMAALEQAVAESLEDLLGKVMPETPVDTGTLKASEHVDGPQRKGFVVEGRVTTGGESSDYAIYVHEGTSKMDARPFIEGPLLEHQAVHIQHVHDACKRAY